MEPSVGSLAFDDVVKLRTLGAREIDSKMQIERTPVIKETRASRDKLSSLRNFSLLIMPILLYLIIVMCSSSVYCLEDDGDYGGLNLNEMPSAAKLFSYNEDENRNEKVAQLAQMAELMNHQSSSSLPSTANMGPTNDGDSLGYEESVVSGSSSLNESPSKKVSSSPAAAAVNISEQQQVVEDPPTNKSAVVNLTSGNDQTQAATSADVPKFEARQQQQQQLTKSDVINSGSSRGMMTADNNHQPTIHREEQEGPHVENSTSRGSSDLMELRAQPLKPEALHASIENLKNQLASEAKLANFELDEAHTKQVAQLMDLGQVDRKVATSGAAAPGSSSHLTQSSVIVSSNNSNANNRQRPGHPTSSSQAAAAAAAAANQEPFAPEILHDHNHESDKLRHQTAQAGPVQQPSNNPALQATNESQQPPQQQQHPQRRPQAQDHHNQAQQQARSNLPSELPPIQVENPKLDVSGWIPSLPRVEEQEQRKNPQVVQAVAAVMSQRKQQPKPQEAHEERKQKPKNDVINFTTTNNNNNNNNNNNHHHHQLLMQSPQIATIKRPTSQEDPIQQPQQPSLHDLEEFSDSSDILADTGNYFMAANEMSFQSSPQPKHVSPPFIHESLEQQDRWLRPTAEQLQVVGQQAPIIPHLASTGSQPHLPGRFTASKLAASSSSPGAAVRPDYGHSSSPAASIENMPLKGPLMSSLKAKSFGLLPRLAAKIFSSKQQDAAYGGLKQQQPEMDILNQQQSFQSPVHNAAPSHQQWTMNQQPSGATSQTLKPTTPSGSKLGFPKGSSLMKSLFSRDPQLFRGALLLSTRRPKIVHEASTATTTTAAATRPLASRPPPLPQSKLVLMNGQVYSVLSGPPSSPAAAAAQFGAGGPTDSGNSFNQQQQQSMKAAIFDHQTSDTSEFPVFEAISMHHHHHHMNAGPASLATLDSMPQVHQSSRNSAAAPVGPVRCDRPRHVIQADRSVVNHILQSQQNFVIARVPIRKYVRPPDTTTASSSSPSSSSPASHLYHAFPIQMLTSMSAPSVAYGSGGASSFGPTGASPYSMANTNRVPSTTAFYHQEPSIEVATVVSSRPSIWQSLANFVSSLRPRRPEHQAQLTIQTGGGGSGGGGSTSGSSPSAVYVSGPLILATAKRRRGRRFDGSNPNQGNPSKTRATTKRKGHLLNHPFPGSRLFGGGRQLADRILYAAASSRLDQQMDPMQRLLMLKTATENEVCSPVSESGNKIKYSCLPNYCVAVALANVTMAGNVHYQSEPTNGFEVYRQQQGNKMATATTTTTGNDNNILQRPISGSDADEKLQVHQFDDMPSPLVTYTHLNAYEPPPFSKLAQPQHQQFVTTSQALDALANNESEEAEMMAGGGGGVPSLPHHQQIVYRPWVNNVDGGNLQPIMAPHQAGQGLLYVQYPTTAPPVNQQQLLPVRNQSPQASGGSGSRGSSQKPAQNTVAFGTAYVTPTPVPANRQKQQNSKRANRAPKATTRKPNDNSDDSFDTDSGEPNEFAAAVDDQLERPIRVKTTIRKQQSISKPGGNKFKKQQPEVENGGTGAENLLINSKQPVRQPAKQKNPYDHQNTIGGAQSGGRKQRRRAGNSGGWLPSPPVRGGASANPMENSPVEDEPEYEEAMTDYESSGEPEPPGGGAARSLKNRKRLSSSAPGNTQFQTAQQPLQQPPINMTHPIPVLNGMPGYTAQAANPRERKMRRRDNYQRGQPPQQMGPTTGVGSNLNRFGFRQSTPLPPPEKSDYEPQPQIIDDDGLNSSNGQFDQNGYMINNTTDCNCNKIDGQTGSEQLIGSGPTTWPDSSDFDDGSVKRNPTTLRPRGGSGGGSSRADLMLAKDRRQIQQQQLHGSSGGLVQYTTKRPYNLRNTTYKNLLLQGNQNVPNQLAPPDAAALLAPLDSGPDISTTTAISTTPDDLSSVSSWPPSGNGSSTTTSSSEAPEQLIRHHVTYNNPEVRSHGHSSSLIPPLTSTTTQATTSNDYNDLENLAGERFHELSSDDGDDSLGSGRRRPNQADTQAGWRARLLANRNSNDNNQTTGRPHQGGSTGSFKPSSVNDILAQARREQRASTRMAPSGSPSQSDGSLMKTLDLERRQSAASLSSQRGAASMQPPTSSLRKNRDSAHHKSSQAVSNGTSGGNDNNDDDDGNENDVTPHQYQIQLRWSNTTTSGGSTVGPGELDRQARKLAAIDRMRERVRDNLYEHREEEHWHDKDWLKAGLGKKLVNGRWKSAGDKEEKSSGPLSLAEPSSIDYGPHANERETPVRDQLSNFPTKEETERHFAIPTPNFLQSSRFVNWVQEAVNMDEEPGEPQAKQPKATKPSASDPEHQQQQDGESGSSSQASQQMPLLLSTPTDSRKSPANKSTPTIISSTIATAKQPSPPSPSPLPSISLPTTTTSTSTISPPGHQLEKTKQPKPEAEVELKLGS